MQKEVIRFIDEKEARHDFNRIALTFRLGFKMEEVRNEVRFVEKTNEFCVILQSSQEIIAYVHVRKYGNGYIVTYAI